MTQIIEFLKGKKSYGIGAIGILVFISARLGWIETTTEITIYEALGIAGIFTLRAAISKVE